MPLIDLVDNNRTDKNTTHCYLDLYEKLLGNKQQSAENVLEIGVGSGGSIKLWRDYFVNAKIHGIDTLNVISIWNDLMKDPRIKLYPLTDGYNPEFVKINLLDKNLRFDFMLDDGPHTIESLYKFIELYSPLMKPDGILIIEDVQDYAWFELLKEHVPDQLKPYIEIYDLRNCKNRYDDLVFVINKNKTVSS